MRLREQIGETSWRDSRLEDTSKECQTLETADTAHCDAQRAKVIKMQQEFDDQWTGPTKTPGNKRRVRSQPEELEGSASKQLSSRRGKWPEWSVSRV